MYGGKNQEGGVAQVKGRGREQSQCGKEFVTLLACMTDGITLTVHSYTRPLPVSSELEMERRTLSRRKRAQCHWIRLSALEVGVFVETNFLCG